MARRRGASRSAARAASTFLRTPTPQVEPSSDDREDVAQSGQATPQEDEAEDQEDEEMMDDGDEDGPATPGNDSEALSRNATPARARSSIPAKRRAGRPPKARPHDWDAPDDTETREGASDMGTPRKRGGWRGRGFGGGRWGKPRGGPSHVSQVPLDKDGNMANVIDDEIELSEDPDGEKKVDKLGRLQGGREYRVRVFTITGKGERLYMLSTEPARCIGFRDSYLFFQKHKNLFKIILPEEAKRDLIERSLIPHSYKGRAIGVVTARSVFREFGSQIIIGGKKIMDDYQVAVAKANGDVEGELAVPDDRLPSTGQGYDKNRYVAWHGASSVYHSGVPTVPMPSGKMVDGKKRKVHVTGANWMFEHAREASRFNSTLAINRRRNLEGIYEPHTNMMHFPRIIQPTHGRWEQLPTPATTPDSSCGLGNESRKAITNGMDVDLAVVETSTARESSFPNPPSALLRNFMITDIHHVSPPRSGLGIPGPDGSVFDVGSGGLVDVPNGVIAELPQSCRQAFEETRLTEQVWKSSWGTEKEDGSRGQLLITYSGLNLQG